MLEVFKKAVLELFTITRNRTDWKMIRGYGQGKNLLIIGNGPSVGKINKEKLVKAFPCDQVDLAFVNGFLHSPPFEIAPYRKHFFISDPYVKVFLHWLVEKESNHLVGSRELVDYLFKDAPDDVQDSMLYDTTSIVRALEDGNIKWFAPESFRNVLAQLGVAKFFPLSRLSIPQTWSVWLRLLILRCRLFGPNFINPLGPAVINYAIMMGINAGYSGIYVVGHNDDLNYHNYKIKDGKFTYAYRYFWESEDREYVRNDTWSEICSAQFGNIQVEKVLNDVSSTSIYYLSKSHLHLFLTDPSVPNIFD